MKSNMIKRLTSRLLRIESPLGMRRKLKSLLKLGSNSTGTRFSKQLSSNVQSSLSSLPIFRFLGDTGLRTTSADISRDEQTHVAANTLVCQALGLEADKALNDLRRRTLAWAIQSLSPKSDNRYLSRDFWMQSSDSLFLRGRAEGLGQTRAARQPAFFSRSIT